ncbi:unnamed protein product [Rhizoctonia solani]|uniref:Uncharacterized protein n=1 Tax=Rhizoctonia solani TaxID=456999 RepID=A0A8H3CV92_9AGAM|nr:unnamed protein product [Rhizoctonia solani]
MVRISQLCNVLQHVADSEVLRAGHILSILRFSCGPSNIEWCTRARIEDSGPVALLAPFRRSNPLGLWKGLCRQRTLKCLPYSIVKGTSYFPPIVCLANPS